MKKYSGILVLIVVVVSAILIVKIFGETVSSKFSEANHAVVGDISFGGGESSAAPRKKKMAVEGDTRARVQKTQPKSKTGAKTWKRSNKALNLPTIFVGEKEQLSIDGAHISVKIDGFRARVLVDAFFDNEKDQLLEGTFKMRLPQGASPYYFAFGESRYIKKDTHELPFIKQGMMDLSPAKIEEMRSGSWTSPKIARVVPKEKAAFAYTQTVQRGVDPALGEWAGSDVFNFRVYPLNAHSLNRIVIGYDVDLTPIGSDWEFAFQVPKFDGPLLLDFDIAQADNLSILPASIVSKESYGRRRFRILAPSDDEIKVRYNLLENTLLQGRGDDPYFTASFESDLPASAQNTSSDTAIIALDTSLSSQPDKFNIWLKLAEAILRNNNDEIKFFNVLLFSIDSSWWKQTKVVNSPENIDAFLSYANTLALEGASDVNQALVTIATTPWAKKSADNIFLLSDGSDTWGENDSNLMANNINKNDRLFAYNTGMSGTSTRNLAHFTRVSGGAIFSVTGEAEIKDASRAFRVRPWKIDSVNLSGGTDLLIQGRPSYLYKGQRLRISGRGKIGDSSVLTVQISQNEKRATMKVPIKRLFHSSLAKRAYGQSATQSLEEFGDFTEKESIAYARHFIVPGKTCSLLMLEGARDYKRFGINPENDAIIVESTTVSSMIHKILADIEKDLGSAKRKFSNWMKKLQNQDGFSFNPPAALKRVVEKTPEESFRVHQKPLEILSKGKKEHSPDFVRALKDNKLDYDIIVKEAVRRKKKYGPHDALKVLSSLVEKNPGDANLTRDVGYSAMEWGLYDQAYFLFRRVIESRPNEPPSYLAIAKALEKSGNVDLALLYYEISVNANWSSRFGEFRRIAILDYIHMLTMLEKKKDYRHAFYVKTRRAALMKGMDTQKADIMVGISWNTNNTDIDLHVTEPNGEECYFSHSKTASNGLLSRDVVEGYGPELYVNEKAPPGNYKIRAKYFASDRDRTSVRTKVYATIYTNWGKPNEKVFTKSVTLEHGEEMHDIMTMNIK